MRACLRYEASTQILCYSTPEEKLQAVLRYICTMLVITDRVEAVTAQCINVKTMVVGSIPNRQ